uniref:Golgi transport 1B n=1 Tax=Oncorhynchus mykiss TaxID=8022 RepID=A0A8K9UJ91_ONCMY
MISLTDSQKIGMGLTGFGVFFLFFGMILFFDKALLAIGNILFVAGLSFVIGLERTFRFFFQKHKMKATSFFLGGVLIVLIGWPIVGVVLEVYGFFLLFRWVQYRHQAQFVKLIFRIRSSLEGIKPNFVLSCQLCLAPTPC